MREATRREAVHAAAFCVLLLLVPRETARAAEAWWSAPAPPDHVGISVAKVALTGPDRFTTGSTGWNFSVRSTIRPNLVLLIDVPAGHAAYDGVDGPRDGWAAGNAFLGAEFGSRKSGVYGQFGVRLPSASDDRSLPLDYALLTDIQSPERYVTDHVTVSLLGSFGGGEGAGAVGRFRIEPVLLLPTGDEEGVEALLRLSLAAFFGDGPLWVGAGISVEAMPTIDYANSVGDLLNTEFSGTIAFRNGSLRPGGFVRLPVVLRSAPIDAVYGLSLRWLL